MIVTAYKTPRLEAHVDVWPILESALPSLPERSVLAVTSKILSLAEGRVLPVDSVDKHDLVRQEADWYTEPHSSKYDLMLAVRQHHLFVNAGIDESNANGQFVLWPEDPQRWANEIWQWGRKRFGLKEFGVVITDSKTSPLHWGVTGAALAHCGFLELESKIGKEDLFGRPLHMTQVNVAQALAATAVYEMGESNESTPLAVISDIRDITFQDHTPTQTELDALRIELEDDAFAPVLSKAEWKKGGGGKKI